MHALLACALLAACGDDGGTGDALDAGRGVDSGPRPRDTGPAPGVDSGSAPSTRDPFGVEMLYPTAAGGEEFFLDMDDPMSDPRFDPRDPIERTDDGWRISDAQVRITVNHSPNTRDGYAWPGTPESRTGSDPERIGSGPPFSMGRLAPPPRSGGAGPSLPHA